MIRCFHFLRSGMADISREEIDELENYVIRTGARGYRTYSRLFTRRTEELQEMRRGANRRKRRPWSV